MSAATAPPVTLPPCPECRSGRHIRCMEKTWDDVASDFAPCPCADAGHYRQSSAHQRPN